MAKGQKKIDRIRAARGLPPQTRENLMARTRAAVALCNTRGGASEATKLNAFMALFHPEVEPGTLPHIKLMQDARARDRRG